MDRKIEALSGQREKETKENEHYIFNICKKKGEFK